MAEHKVGSITIKDTQDYDGEIEMAFESLSQSFWIDEETAIGVIAVLTKAFKLKDKS
jgi:hypothetical protein